MEIVLLSAILMVLIVVAIELSVLIQRFDRFPARILTRQEKKEGPTINVNVGTVSTATPPSSPPTVPIPETVSEPVEEPEPESLAPPLPPPPRPMMFSSPVNRSPSGLGVVECPKCKAENSSFRSECFNCGAKL